MQKIKCRVNKDNLNYVIPLLDSTQHYGIYTGLADVKGQEIYSGDIVCVASKTIYTVEFIQGAFQLINANSIIPICSIYDFYQIQIVGNKFVEKGYDL